MTSTQSPPRSPHWPAHLLRRFGNVTKPRSTAPPRADGARSKADYAAQAQAVRTLRM